MTAACSSSAACASRSATPWCSTASTSTVDERDVIALIGASGSGKSTLLRCINLLEPIDDGAIVLDGVDITEPGVDADRGPRAGSASCSRASTCSRT